MSTSGDRYVPIGFIGAILTNAVDQIPGSRMGNGDQTSQIHEQAAVPIQNHYAFIRSSQSQTQAMRGALTHGAGKGVVQITGAQLKPFLRCFVDSYDNCIRAVTGQDLQTGHIFDHHAVQYEYPGDAWMFSQCRQIDGCRNDVSEHLMGSEGNCDFGRGSRITGKNAWTYEGGRGDPDPYQVEHDDLFASIRSGQVLNEGKYVAESTLTAIMGRMATYTGREITWEDALNSDVSLGPDVYEMGSLETPAVPMPGSSG